MLGGLGCGFVGMLGFVGDVVPLVGAAGLVEGDATGVVVLSFRDAPPHAVTETTTNNIATGLSLPAVNTKRRKPPLILRNPFPATIDAVTTQ
jgi:hypothetical protein